MTTSAKIRRLSLWIILAGLGFAAGALWVDRRLSDRHAREVQQWERERADLEAALDQARAVVPLAPSPVVAPAAATPLVRLSPAEIIARLGALRTPVGPEQMRQAVYWLEELAHLGPESLPAIAEFLARNVDVELDTSGISNRSPRSGKLPGDFLLPPSLRLGLLDVARRIGGSDAEKICIDALSSTARGLEVAYITRLLEELAPAQHREAALSTARTLLASTTAPNSNSPLDRFHRDYLFAVLSFFGDTSYATTAQAQLISSEGKLDRSALRYLQQTLGAQAVPMAAQAYSDSRLRDPGAKEPFARLALAFVGADNQANEFYQKAINDPTLTKSQRRNLIEDLNEAGFADPRNLTAKDLPLIQNRLALIEKLAPGALDDANAGGFKEAYKDLVNMEAKASGQPPPKR